MIKCRTSLLFKPLLVFELNLRKVFFKSFAILAVAGSLLLIGYRLGEYRIYRLYSPPTNESIIKRFNSIYYNLDLWDQSSWLGIKSYQTPTDNWVMQEIISEIKPDFFIETGTANAGTTLFYASVLDQVNPQGKIITIDIEDLIASSTREMPVFKNKVEFIQGDSVAPEVLSRIAGQVQGRKVMVTLDSSHAKKHVLKELQTYADFVSVGSYLVVQDTNVNGHPVFMGFGPGPREAVTEFLKIDKRFEIDSSKEKFLLTFYPSGYLKRVR